MVQFVMLGKFTQKRNETIKDLQASVKDSRSVFESFGVKITNLVFTMGRYNVVALMEAPDEEAMTKAVLSWGSKGLLKIETFRAFSPELMIKMTNEI